MTDEEQSDGIIDLSHLSEKEAREWVESFKERWKQLIPSPFDKPFLGRIVLPGKETKLEGMINYD